jgi:DNA-binding NarL/FixJ family response regulator
MTPIRVLLVDDHPIVLHGLQQLFAGHDEFSVAATCADGRTAVEAVRNLRPDVLVLDLRMAPMNGLDVLRMLASEHLACRTVMLTAAVADDEVVQAMQFGAMALILKDASPDRLIDCVRRVHRGEQWIERDTVTDAFTSVLKREALTSEAEATLTPRELEVVRMVGLGFRNKVIGERLGISEGTVKVHLHNIYEKFGVDGRLALMLYVRAKGLA